MSDRSATQITIGGRIRTASALRTFVGAVSNDTGPEYGGGFEGEEDAIDYIKTAVDQGLPVYLFDEEARGGAFWNLEHVLRELRLEYVRSDDGHYAYAASHASHKNGADRECFGSTETGPCLALSQLTEALANGADALVALVAAAERAFAPPEKLEIDPGVLADYLHELAGRGDSPEDGQEDGQ